MSVPTAPERLRNLSRHDWKRLSTLITMGEVDIPDHASDPRTILRHSILKAEEAKPSLSHEDRSTQRAAAGLAAVYALDAIMIYRLYLEEMEAQVRLEQHIEAVVADSVELEIAE